MEQRQQAVGLETLKRRSAVVVMVYFLVAVAMGRRFPLVAAMVRRFLLVAATAKRR